MTVVNFELLLKRLWSRKQLVIAVLSLACILLHFFLKPMPPSQSFWSDLPLMVVLAGGGVPLLADLLRSLSRREVGTDVLAGLAIVTCAVLGEYLAGAIIVLMLSGGEALESYAVHNAASVLRALAKRMPSVAHRRTALGLENVTLDEISVRDILVVFPHETCPVDGTVIEGAGTMDESFLTGEPFRIAKAPGSSVISGAVNGPEALTIRVDRRAQDSRYAKIMEVMRRAEEDRPRMRRLGDQLASIYVPVSLAVAVGAWLFSHDSTRFLSVLVIATPCPLLIGIPVAILGAISLCARRAIVVKHPAVLEQIRNCRTAIFDKTGTLTYGEPQLAEVVCDSTCDRRELLRLTASLEQYSKHPLARAILAAAKEESIPLDKVAEVQELPGQGLRGIIGGGEIRLTSRNRLSEVERSRLPAVAQARLECIVMLNGRYTATFRFRDKLREDGKAFVAHLAPRHGIRRVLLVSGDRYSEVRYLAEQVGITEVFAEQSPEQKLAIVKAETAKAPTVYVGDGINDAPALMAATVGIAIGQHSDITSEAAGIVIMDSSLARVDEFMHIGARMRRIAIQSAVGGMLLSAVGMGFAAAGLLSPVLGALLQEVIDVLAVLNALRTALPPGKLSDYHLHSL